MTQNFDNYLFRCSELGNIITDSGKLTVGSKTYLKECFISQIYGVRKEAYGKALEKGIACEPDGLALLNKALFPERYIAKIQDSKKNEYIMGTPDAIIDEMVYDIKNAYTLFSFGKAELTHLHEWQLKGYCFLHGLKAGRIFYCINNMPDYLISEEERSMFYKLRKWTSFDDPEYLAACDELRKAYIYDNLPIHHKFKIFEVEFTEEDETRIKDGITQARKYLNGLFHEHQAMLSANLEMMNIQMERPESK